MIFTFTTPWIIGFGSFFVLPALKNQIPRKQMTFNIEKEDRALNQYWYSAKTIAAMVAEIELHGERVAFLSTPSLFFSLTKGGDVAKNAVLFEFDKSFGDQIAAAAVANDGATDDGAAARTRQFCFFDYNAPDKIPMQFMGQFDYVVVDPPFITQQVWSKYGEAVSFLLQGHPGMKGNDREAKKGKVMFTSILENHNMLEETIDGPLFIALHMPSIPHLVYQYYILTNYPPSSEALQTLSTEVLFGQSKNGNAPDQDEVKVLRALQMANDLRESEVAFTQQARNRNRDNDEVLPAFARQQKVEEDRKNRYVANDGSLVPEIKSCAAPTGGPLDGSNPLLNKPIDEMRWSHVPEGLSEFASTADPSAFDESTVIEFGAAYDAAAKVRAMLDEFKRGVDALQRHCDTLMKLNDRERRIAASGAEGELAEVKRQNEEASEEKKKLEASMRAIKAELEGSQDLKGHVDASLLACMEDCVHSYETVEIKKPILQALAADATRKFKSPVFNRQKELLQDMKMLKAAAIGKAKEAAARARNKETAAAASS